MGQRAFASASTRNMGGGVIPYTDGGVGPRFFDDFLGSSLDASKWQGPYDRRGDVANSELQAMTPANVTIAGSILSITAKHETVTAADRDEAAPHNLNTGTAAGTSGTYNYTSGQIMTVNTFLYGTITCRFKPPAGSGVWPLVWTLGSNWDKQLYTANQIGENWPVDAWCEMDIAEFGNFARTSVNCESHYQTANRGPGIEVLPYDASTRFMVYRVEWSPSAVIWSVDPEDGSGFHTLGSVTGTAVPAFAQYIVLSMAVGGFGGTPINADYPLVAQYDYVRVTY